MRWAAWGVFVLSALCTRGECGPCSIVRPGWWLHLVESAERPRCGKTRDQTVLRNTGCAEETQAVLRGHGLCCENSGCAEKTQDPLRKLRLCWESSNFCCDDSDCADSDCAEETQTCAEETQTCAEGSQTSAVKTQAFAQKDLDFAAKTQTVRRKLRLC